MTKLYPATRNMHSKFNLPIEVHVEHVLSNGPLLHKRDLQFLDTVLVHCRRPLVESFPDKFVQGCGQLCVGGPSFQAEPDLGHEESSLEHL